MINSSDTLENLALMILPSLVSAIVGWFFGRRKTNAESNALEIENVDKGLAVYRKMIEDLSQKIQSLQTNQNKLEAEHQEMKLKLQESESENAKLRKRIIALEKMKNHNEKN